MGKPRRALSRVKPIDFLIDEVGKPKDRRRAIKVVNQNEKREPKRCPVLILTPDFCLLTSALLEVS